MRELKNVLKTLIAGYVITVVMLFIIALCLYKMSLGEQIVGAGVLVTYGVSVFVGALMLAKIQKSKRLMWGIVYGMVYFAIILAASIIANKGISCNWPGLAKTFAVCVISGLVGGFVSP